MNKQVGKDGTVGKALEVLDLVASLGRPVRFTELMSLSKFPKASLYRFLQTLTNQGMLSYDAKTQSYAPGLRLVRLAHSAWRQSSLAPIARPFLDTLSGKVGEAVHLAQLDHGHVLFVDKRKSTEKFDTLAQAGKIAPSYCTGVGKAILAFMPDAARELALQQQAFLKYTPATHENINSLSRELADIRKNGIAYDREEHEVGIISIAAPIITEEQAVIGALSIATSTSRHSLDALDTFRPELLETAAQIASAASTWQFPTQN
jgi:DNA-binding IclR family transcriptional regulator